MTNIEAVNALAKLAFPYAIERISAAKRDHLKFAHYTTAESAALILKNRSLWLRNASMMNDFSEVEHGRACLAHIFQAQLGGQFQKAVDAVYPDLAQEVAGWLEEAHHQAKYHTYLASFAGHDPFDETGKLSMWRAYGGTTASVALIFNTDFLGRDDNQLGAVSSPVLYGDVMRFAEEFHRVVVNLESNAELMKVAGRDAVKIILFNSFQFSVLSTKHDAFKEEEEWRVIYRPKANHTIFIEESAECIKGVPQMVYKIPLRDQAGLEMPELQLDRLIHRIIIGPCDYPKMAMETFREILRQANVPDADGRVKYADIPYRHVR